jgi:predicted small secreted protein
MRKSLVCPTAALALLAACKTNDVGEGVKSAGSAVADGAQSVVGAGTSLVNVNLSNVLNDLALDLKIDKANIPVNAQIPVTIAANVCGVSINILSVSTGGSSGGCTATTSSPELAQVVQQQIAAGGSVGGGGQTTGGTTTGTTTPPTGSSTGQTQQPTPTTPQ